jgi:hypothetical protein
VLDALRRAGREVLQRLPSRLLSLAPPPFQKFVKFLEKLLLFLSIEPWLCARRFRFRRAYPRDLGRRSRFGLCALNDFSAPLWHFWTVC